MRLTLITVLLAFGLLQTRVRADEDEGTTTAAETQTETETSTLNTDTTTAGPPTGPVSRFEASTTHVLGTEAALPVETGPATANTSFQILFTAGPNVHVKEDGEWLQGPVTWLSEDGARAHRRLTIQVELWRGEIGIAHNCTVEPIDMAVGQTAPASFVIEATEVMTPITRDETAGLTFGCVPTEGEGEGEATATSTEAEQTAAEATATVTATATATESQDTTTAITTTAVEDAPPAR